MISHGSGWSRMVGALLSGLGLSIAAPSQAGEPWLLTVEAPAAFPVSEQQRASFNPGSMPAIATYRPLSRQVLLGFRLRGGGLVDGPKPGDKSLKDPGYGGFAAAMLGARWRPLAPLRDTARTTGLWLEVSGGVGVTGHLLGATAEAALGWNFQADTVTLGPIFRYLHFVRPSNLVSAGEAQIALVGVEVNLFDRRRARSQPSFPLIATTAPEAALPAPEAQTDRDRDADLLLDVEDRCPAEPEDRDGCPGRGVIEMADARIVLAESVLFDSGFARVKTAARPTLRAVVVLWDQHPEWHSNAHIIIEGHTDVRGSAKHNRWLSLRRAQRVRKVLIELGLPAGRLEAVGLGPDRPRDDGKTKAADQRNRRIEFVVSTDRAGRSQP